jgi:hypothetical protein
LLKETEKITIKKSGKIITDEIKDIISTINYDEYNSLKQRKTEMRIVVEMQKSSFSYFDTYNIYALSCYNKNLKVRNNELEVFTASQKLLSNYSLV